MSVTLTAIVEKIDAILRGQHDGWDQALAQVRDEAREALKAAAPADQSAHAQGYRVDLESDPLRQAAHLLSDFIAVHELEPYQRPYSDRAMAGDLSGLDRNTLVGMKFIRAQLERDPGTTINGYTVALMQAVKEWPFG